MKRSWSITVLAGCCLALLALHCNQPATDTRAADETAIRSINPNWFKFHTAGDVDGIVALYAEDAVLNVPGAPAARGHAEIRELLKKDIEASAASGTTLNGSTTTEVGVSGDLGWEWSTFTATNKSGTIVDRGKYVTVYGRKNGKWLIIRDIWNSDGPI